MRLSILDSGHSFTGKLKLAGFRAMAGRDPSDVVKLLLYRPELFGTPFSDLVHDVLRGPSEWTVAERELFASFTSRMNYCVF